MTLGPILQTPSICSKLMLNVLIVLGQVERKYIKHFGNLFKHISYHHSMESYQKIIQNLAQKIIRGKQV